MTDKTTPLTGRCTLCKKEVPLPEAVEHLKECRAAHPMRPTKTPRAFYLVKVWCEDFPEYFLFTEMSSRMSLFELDGFLRRTWLECCGHLSCFEVNGRKIDTYVEGGDRGGWRLATEIDRKVSGIFTPGFRFRHVYDYGTSTGLVLEVAGERQACERTPYTPVLLMRNTPPDWRCVECGKPATLVDVAAECGTYPENVYCKTCAKKKAVAKDVACFLPIMNSPRSGVCGYGM